MVNQLGSGTVFGEIAMLGGERRSASVRTAAASTLVRIPRAALLPMLAADAGLRHSVWGTFAERRFDDLVRGMDRYAHLGRKARLGWLQRASRWSLRRGRSGCWSRARTSWCWRARWS